MAVAGIRVTREESADALCAAARIWARATTKRDNLSLPAVPHEKLPGIQQRVQADGGSLHVARRQDTVVGFAVLVAHGPGLELVYLGVDPDVWGAGVGGSLLAHLEDFARSIGAGGLELWVIDDNERAIAVYERSGWVGTDDRKTQVSTRRLERRLVKDVQRDR